MRQYGRFTSTYQTFLKIKKYLSHCYVIYRLDSSNTLNDKLDIKNNADKLMYNVQLFVEMR